MFTLKSLISFHSRRCVMKEFVRCVKIDPGIAKRKKLLSLDGDDSEMMDFEDLDSDFMDVHKSHKEYVRETELKKEREKYHIVKHKYFKEKFPNFLTWHDKEQIRYLHRSDPEEWTIDKLSEGFPALPDTIKKIVSSNWTKDKQSKITNHDISVQKNWQLFKAGQMSDLPEELSDHLKKFTNRALQFKPFILPDTKKSTVVVQNKNSTTEFSDIIKSYKKATNKSDSDDFQHDQIEEKHIITKNQSKPPSNDTYFSSKSHNKSLITLEELQDRLKIKSEIKLVNEEDKYILTSLSSRNNKIEETKNEMVDLSQYKYKTTGTVMNLKKSERDQSHLTYPEKITIPKQLLRKGSTYKLNDCYYDDDGEFLYRVPGMG